MTSHIIPPPRRKYSHKPWPALVAGLAILAAATASPAQTKITPPPFTSAPKIENVLLYYSFFIYHQNLVNANQAVKNANPAQGSVLDQQMATLLGVNVGELPVVVANTQQVTLAQAQAQTNPWATGTPSAGLAVALQPPQFTMSQRISQYEFARCALRLSRLRQLSGIRDNPDWRGAAAGHLHHELSGPSDSQCRLPPGGRRNAADY